MVNVMCELIFQVLRVILTSVSVLSNPLFRQIQGWIPAFAGMTEGAGRTKGAGMTEGTVPLVPALLALQCTWR
jgi:hypothetical protein